MAYASATEPGYQVSRSGGLAEVRYVGSWVRKVSEATVFRLALVPPRLLNAATRSCIADLACGEDRLDWKLTVPPLDWPVLPPDEPVATQPLSSEAAPAAPMAPAPARKLRRLVDEVFMGLPLRPRERGPAP